MSSGGVSPCNNGQAAASAGIMANCFRWLCGFCGYERIAAVSPPATTPRSQQGQEPQEPPPPGPPTTRDVAPTPEQLLEYMEALTRATPLAIREARGIAEVRGDLGVGQLFWALQAVIIPAENPDGHLIRRAGRAVEQPTVS